MADSLTGAMPAPKREPRVSVVIIFLDAERFLSEAINSVFNQTYGAWELLLVDDGSSDGSTAIARQYAAEHADHVRYFEHHGHANRGMSASRNVGLRHARGTYLGFLDADDVWFDHALEEQTRILDRHPEAAMVYGPLAWWYSWTGQPADQGRDYVEILGVPADDLVRPPRLVPLFLRDKAAVPSGMLVRRDIMDRLGGFQEEFRGEYEDQVFCVKICLEASVYASGRSWYRYRQHPDSCVSRGLRSGATRDARLRFLNWVAGYLRERRVRSVAVWWALELELWRGRQPMAFRLMQRGDQLLRRLRRRLARAAAPGERRQ